MFVWKCCLSWASHSRNYRLVSSCHLGVTDHSWGLPPVNIGITCCHVRAWAAEECLIMKRSASLPCAVCAASQDFISVHEQAAVSLTLLRAGFKNLSALFFFTSCLVLWVLKTDCVSGASLCNKTKRFWASKIIILQEAKDKEGAESSSVFCIVQQLRLKKKVCGKHSIRLLQLITAKSAGQVRLYQV